jgi:hypothetical protein
LADFIRQPDVHEDNDNADNVDTVDAVECFPTVAEADILAVQQHRLQLRNTYLAEVSAEVLFH